MHSRNTNNSIFAVILLALLVFLALGVSPFASRALAGECDELSFQDALKMQSCEDYAGIVRNIAVMRDNGVMSKHISDSLIWAPYTPEIEMVYANPTFAAATPNEIASAVLKWCRKTTHDCRKQIAAALKEADKQQR
jgi:hypothetical protein